MGLRKSSKVSRRARLLPPLQEIGHLFSNRARAGSVPTVCPHALGLCLPASFTISQSKDGLLSLYREGASSKRQQHNLMIKHCCWTLWLALDAQLNG